MTELDPKRVTLKSRPLAGLLAVVLVSSATSAATAQQVEIVDGFVTAGPNVPPRDARPATGRSTIRGRVLAADSGQPMRRAMVVIRAPELRVPRSTLTDADGRYEFRDLPAGRYSINTSKATFVGWSYGQTQPASPGKPLVLADNQTADNINIAMPRGAVITGRVIDEFGDPAPNVFVNLMRPQFSQGQQRLMPTAGGNFQATNDVGEYRLFGLAPGQYYVAAQPQQQGFSGLGASQVEGQEARNGYARTFYPGTADASAAQKITVGIAQTLNEINIVLLPTRVATISGVALDAQGQPLGRGNVQLMPRGQTMVGVITGGPLRPDGTFMVQNVSPGQYILRAMVQRTLSPGAPPSPAEFSVAAVAVSGEDITDVRLTPVAQVTINGRISFDDPATAQSIKPSAIRVVTQYLDDPAMAGFGTAGGPPPLVADDLTFEARTAPGRIALRPLAGELQVSAIRVNGRDVTDSGIEVGGEAISGVEIELTSRRQEISGAVTDAGSGPVKDYVVIVFAQDRARWLAPFNRYFSLGRPGDDGRFKVGTLPPGEYYAIALDRADPTQSQDPEFLEGLSRQASQFSLRQGENRTLDLRLFTIQ